MLIPKTLNVINRDGIEYKPLLYDSGTITTRNADELWAPYINNGTTSKRALGFPADYSIDLTTICDRVIPCAYGINTYNIPWNNISPYFNVYNIGASHGTGEGYVYTELFSSVLKDGTTTFDVGVRTRNYLGMGRNAITWNLYIGYTNTATGVRTRSDAFPTRDILPSWPEDYRKYRINLIYNPELFIVNVWPTNPLEESGTANNFPDGLYSIYLGHGGLNYEAPAPEHNKGEFKGMPTSNIPLRQFIRGNIDYRHTIDIYDETNYSPNNMFLTNRVGTLDYSQVEFGNPSGTIKVKSDINFTHFVSSSFSDDNRPIVYKVDHYETVGAGVIRCSYSVDYIKTFFQYHGITDNNPICMRSTSAVGYEPYIMDNAILSGDYDVNRTILSTNTVTALYVIKTINGIYATSEYGFGLFKSWLADNVNNKVIINQIEKIFIIPFGTFAGHSLTVTSGINFYKPIEGGYTTITFAPAEIAGDIYSITPSNTVGSFVSVSISTSFSDKAMDFLGANSYCMLHVPYYGDIVLNASDIIGMSNNADSPKFHYYIDFDGGNVAVQYHNGDYDGLFHSYVQAPSPSISTVDLESIRYLEASQNIGYTGAITKTLTGLGSSAATGAVAGALTGLGSGAVVGAGVNAVTGLFSAAAGLADMARTNANEMQHLLNTLSTDTVQATGTASAAIKYFYVIMVTPKLSESLADYYDVVGYPIRKAWNTIGAVEGECYWLNWNFALIKDTEEIINGFALASSDGIIYNY